VFSTDVRKSFEMRDSGFPWKLCQSYTWHVHQWLNLLRDGYSDGCRSELWPQRLKFNIRLSRFLTSPVVRISCPSMVYRSIDPQRRGLVTISKRESSLQSMFHTEMVSISSGTNCLSNTHSWSFKYYSKRLQSNTRLLKYFVWVYAE